MNAESQLHLPWRNLSNEWNDALTAYHRRTGRYWHGGLRGTMNRRDGWDRKRCFVLVVVDLWHGKPIDLSEWNGSPDYWDLDKVIAVPVDAVFRGRVKEVAVEDRLHEHADYIVKMHNERLAKLRA